MYISISLVILLAFARDNSPNTRPRDVEEEFGFGDIAGAIGNAASDAAGAVSNAFSDKDGNHCDVFFLLDSGKYS